MFNTPEQLNTFDRMFPTVDVNDLHGIIVQSVKRAMVVEANGTAGDYTESGIAVEALAEIIDLLVPRDSLCPKCGYGYQPGNYNTGEVYCENEWHHYNGPPPAPQIAPPDPEFERLLADEFIVEQQARFGLIRDMTNEQLVNHMVEYQTNVTMNADQWAWYKELSLELGRRTNSKPVHLDGLSVGDIVHYGDTDYPWRITSILPGPNIGVGAMPSYLVRIIPNTPSAQDSTDGKTVPESAVTVVKRAKE